MILSVGSRGEWVLKRYLPLLFCHAKILFELLQLKDRSFEFGIVKPAKTVINGVRKKAPVMAMINQKNVDAGPFVSKLVVLLTQTKEIAM